MSDAQALTRLPSGAVVHLPPEPREAPPVLFFHGVGGGAWSWAPQVTALAQDYDCFVWEGRGHGASPRVRDAGLADYFVDAQEALEAVWTSRRTPVLLVAHSMGAMLALALACQAPERVRGVFLVDPVYAETGARPRWARPLLRVARWLVWPVVRSYQVDGWLSRLISRRFFNWAFLDLAARERAWALQRTVVPLEYPRMLNESIEGVEGFPFRPFAAEVGVAAYFLEAIQRAGAPSRFTQAVARFRARGVRCEHQLVLGGHYLQLDQPASTVAALRGFAGELFGAAQG